METKKFTFKDGKYEIEIYAPDVYSANEAWEYLQNRNYYPTGRKWYTETNSCNPPKYSDK